MPKHETQNTFYSNNLESKRSLVMKFGQFMQYYEIIFLSNNLPKMWPGNWFQAVINFQRVLCKKDSVRSACMHLIDLLLHI